MIRKIGIWDCIRKRQSTNQIVEVEQVKTRLYDLVVCCAAMANETSHTRTKETLKSKQTAYMHAIEIMDEEVGT